jgi:hypothetical protein
VSTFLELEWTNDNPDRESVTFSQDAVWMDREPGTILVLREGGLQMKLPADVATDPEAGDWLVLAKVDDSRYVTQRGF